VKRAALLLVGLAATSGCTGLFFRPDNFLYKRPDDRLEYVTPRFASLDGTPLTGLFLCARKSPVLGTVVHFHGNSGNFTGHFGYTEWLVDEGFNVFVPDYRGYGNSKGTPTSVGVVEDAVAAIRYVRTRPEVGGARVFVLGQSLGGAIATVAAVRSGPEAVRALALECPVSSYRSVARAALRATFVTRVLLRPLTGILVSDAVSPVKAVPDLAPIPLLILHGDADTVVPHSEGTTLFQAAREPKEMVTIPGGRHTEAFTKFGHVYRAKLVEFYRRSFDSTN